MGKRKMSRDNAGVRSVSSHLVDSSTPSEWHTVAYSGRMAERPTGPLPRQGFGEEYGVQWTPRKRV